MSPEEIRERYERVCAEVGPGVTVVAATKYVPLDEMDVLAEAGIPVVGENRAQDLEAKHETLGDAFRWHFIGHLQSRKAGTVNATCELVHSLDSESAARRLEIPALVQVNLAGEETKSGVAPRGARAVPRRLSGRDRRALHHAAARRRSGGVQAVLPPSARARGGARTGSALDGHDAGLPRSRGRGSDAGEGRRSSLPGLRSAHEPRRRLASNARLLRDCRGVRRRLGRGVPERRGALQRCRRARGARLRGAVEHECQAASAPPGVRPRLRRLDVR